IRTSATPIDSRASVSVIVVIGGIANSLYRDEMSAPDAARYEIYGARSNPARYSAEPNTTPLPDSSSSIGSVGGRVFLQIGNATLTPSTVGAHPTSAACTASWIASIA